MRNKGQNIIVCIDASGSMSSHFGNSTRIDAVNDGVEVMLPSLLSQRGTMIGLTGFHDRPFVVLPLIFPNNRQIIGKVKSIRLGGCTNLLGGIDLSCNLLLKRPICFSRRIIVLADGGHNTGNHSFQEIVSKAQKHNIVIDTIGIGEKNSYNNDYLVKLSRKTWGEFTDVADLPKLLLTFKKLSSPKYFKPANNRGKVIPFNLFRRYKS